MFYIFDFGCFLERMFCNYRYYILIWIFIFLIRILINFMVIILKERKEKYGLVLWRLFKSIIFKVDFRVKILIILNSSFIIILVIKLVIDFVCLFFNFLFILSVFI